MKRFENAIWFLKEAKVDLEIEKDKIIQRKGSKGSIWKQEIVINELDDAIDKLKEY